MAGSSYDSDSDDSLDDDSFIDLYSHVERSSRRLIRRQSREPDPVSDSPQGSQELERRSSRSLLGKSNPSLDKSNRQPQSQPQRRVSSSSHDGEMPKSRSPTSRRRTSVTDQPSGMLGSFLANEQSKSSSSSPKGSRSICSAPALVRRKSSDSVDCGASVGSRKTVSHNTQQRPPGESSSRSSRSVSQSRSVSRPRQHSSRNFHGSSTSARGERSSRPDASSRGERSSRPDASSRGERSSRPDASSRGERSSGRSDPKDAESMVASKLREIRKGQDEQRRKSQELKRSMSQRHAYRSGRSTSVSRSSSRNLARQNSSDSLSYGNTSTRSSSSARTSSSSPKPTRNSSYLDNLFAPGTQ